MTWRAWCTACRHHLAWHTTSTKKVTALVCPKCGGNYAAARGGSYSLAGDVLASGAVTKAAAGDSALDEPAQGRG
jgi:hypothetical protein